MKVRASLVAIVAFSLFLGFGIGSMGAVAILKLSGNTQNISSNENESFDSAYLDDIYDQLDKRYLGDLPDKTEITEEMARGMIKALDDPYTNYLDPEEAKSFMESRDPNFEGIGVVLGVRNDSTFVETVLNGYPADKGGILEGDIISEVNEENVEGKTPQYIASKIKGPKDTEVKLKVFRPENNELLDFTLVRKLIEVDNISYKDEGNGIYRIIITQFIDKTPEEFIRSWDRIAAEIDQKDVKGLIVDLRGNPGGYVAGVKHILEDFLTDGQILYMEESKDKAKVSYTDDRRGVFEGVPLVVLVDEGSASASEIFATSIQDNEKGYVIGTNTVGKGVEQEVTANDDGSMMIVVFQRWLTPDGRAINKDDSVKPDKFLELDVEKFRKDGVDNQLEEAKGYLNSNN